MDSDREQFNAAINARLEAIEKRLDFLWRNVVYQHDIMYDMAKRRGLEHTFDHAKPSEAMQRIQAQLKDTK